MKSLRLLWLIAIVVLPLPQNLARAQSDKAPLTTSRNNLIAATEAARTATQEVLALHTKQLAEATRKLEGSDHSQLIISCTGIIEMQLILLFIRTVRKERRCWAFYKPRGFRSGRFAEQFQVFLPGRTSI